MLSIGFWPRCVLCSVLLLMSGYQTEALVEDCVDITNGKNCSNTALTAFPSVQDIPDVKVLQTLDLSHNSIRTLMQNDFQSDTDTDYSLVTLNLANNQIAEIEENSFEKLTSLVYLDLSGNLLKGSDFNEDMFNDLKSLRNLSLERNPFQIIRKMVFNFMELTALRDLDLSHCQISVIEEGGLDLRALERLDLSWNLLETLNPSSFEFLIDLQILDLSHNKLKVLTEMPMFPRLITLYLDSNELSELSLKDEVFQKADTMRELYIRNNEIRHFGPNSLPWELESMRIIALDYNPVQCDCRMKWIADDEFLTKSNYTIRCQYPVRWRGKNLLTLTESQLICGYPLKDILIIVGAGIVGIMVVVGFILYFVRRRKSRRQRQTRKSAGQDYTAVYTKDDDDDDATVSMKITDAQRLLADESSDPREFDV